MDQFKLYNTAKGFAEKLKRYKSCYGGLEAAVIIGDNEKVYMGVTNVNIVDGSIADVPADVAAFLNMRNSGGRIAAGLAVIKLDDMSFSLPSSEAMELMFRSNTENDGCLVCLGRDEGKLLSVLRLGADGGSLMDGFDFDDDAPGDTTANVISGIAVDEDNPFYEKNEEVASPEETLSVISEEQKADALRNTKVEPELTPEDLLKQAKKRKNVAKSNFLFRKKHRDV